MVQPGAKRLQLGFWLLLASLNIAAGLVLAMRPERAGPLRNVRQWAQEWLFDGSNIYGVADSVVDYPPNAIVALSVLALTPDRLVVPAWALFNLALLGVAPFLAGRVVAPRGPCDQVALLVLLFLCWGSTRTLLQFSLLMLVLGLAALAYADARPRWSGVCLGLSLMKPQIAAPFLLWALLTKRWKLAALAILVVALGIELFCLRVGANPLSVATQYLHILRTIYAGDNAMTGESHLRPLLAQGVDGAAADVATALVSLVLLGLACGPALGQRNAPLTVMYSAPAMAGAWSLLTFYHLTYGFVLLLPASALLLLDDDAGTRRARHAVFWMVQVSLMIDVPGVWRRIGASLPQLSFVDTFFVNFDRFLILALFVALFALGARRARRQGDRSALATPPAP